MNTQERINKLTNFLSNETIMKKIANAETKIDMLDIFVDNGIEMTMDELDILISIMNSNNNNEISEDELEMVSGGVVGAGTIFAEAWNGISLIAKACWEAGKWFAKIC